MAIQNKGYTTRKTCRVCGNPNLTEILSMGNMYVSNFIDSEKGEKPKAPLELVLCAMENGGCGLLQLRHTFDASQMYKNYWYRSGMNKTMTDELVGIAETVSKIAELKSGDTIIDIGCNDGTLLKGYKISGLERVGFEPATNLIPYAKESGAEIINDFFGANPFEKLKGDTKAKVITAIAMFYDLENPNIFVSDVAKVLDRDGIFIIQMSYLPLMLTQNAFDNICHEHLEYYSLSSLENLIKRHGLEIFDAELNDVNGGSYRIYMRHKGSRVGEKISGRKNRLEKLKKLEKDMKLNEAKVYRDFVKRVNVIKNKVSDFIKEETKKGKKVFVYGASTKGNTLLQYFNLNSSLIPFAAERNSMKWGKKTVGTNIPIISEEEVRKKKPDYFLILPWHFMPEFLKREADFLKGGGKFLVPLPKCETIGMTKGKIVRMPL